MDGNGMDGREGRSASSLFGALGSASPGAGARMSCWLLWVGLRCSPPE